MASKYLDLYQGAGQLRQGGAMGSSSAYNPGGFQIGTPQNVFYQSGTTEKVVHDQYNNKYYGTQNQSDLTKGLANSIARLQAELDKGGRNSWQQGWMGNGGSMKFNKFDAKTIANQNAQIESQKTYLDQINNGMYKQESSTFFDSYDDWTGDWDKLFQRRRMNTKIEGQNAALKAKNNDTKQIDTSVSGGNPLTIKPKVEVNTGISKEATKLSDALLKDNGLSI
jgi:hypothetical protein